MPLRNIIQINEDLCDGCGKCITGCAEGALALVNGKARLVKESFCDGLGACIGECPRGALTIERRDAAEFDEAAAAEAARNHPHPARAIPSPAGACPGSAQRTFAPRPSPAQSGAGLASALTHWPIQLHLIMPDAPAFRNADILIAASCTAFACGQFHPELLEGRSLIIACPKLDKLDGYLDKLTALFLDAQPRSVTVARMVVPCCHGLTFLVKQAREMATSDVPVEEVVISLEGERMP